ncbi:radical SAM/SPASM domain-containing protein [Methylobacterium nodulans]|uniref:Radical SAM domain protein n=1 Tax=Methylobacterium nodulans (strain LMG 21967 / CNCM I-2342 / ORS 2060) TaxID=460265 RepID=B8II35_METNO|nr:radical SAM protein [Methylobacterium nodulans]ACL57904.1 Radical SAM domain protein [Methylobacterium nodulans ORS 2060]
MHRPSDEPTYDGDPRSLARWRPGGSAPPSHAVWEITLRCDLGCRHCGSRAGRARRDELSTDAALDVVAQLADLGLREVTLIGGEFYLREDWDRIAAAITRRGMLCSIVTGARQMTRARIARAVAAGVGKISLSIDGLEQTHDSVRGSAGSWQAAVTAGRRIASSGIDLSVNTQINRLTMPELPGVADLLVEIGARSWMVILTAAMGRAADRRALMLQPYHLLHLFPLLAAIKRERLDPAGIAFFPANNIGYFGPLAETLRYGAEGGHAWAGCDAGVASLGIEADGRLKGCPSLPSADYTMGNVRDHSLAQLWAKRTPNRPIAAAEDLWGFCWTCPHATRCRGGCTWTSHVLFGRRGNNPFCHYRALALAERGFAEAIEPVSVAPGEPFDFGRHRIVELPLPTALTDDPVIERTLASHVFGLRPGTASVWSPDEREEAVI